MDSELHYLQRRARFHRTMARRAACGEAEMAHEAFARAYQERIDEMVRAASAVVPEVESVGAEARRGLQVFSAAG
jgi:hypothetical protein